MLRPNGSVLLLGLMALPLVSWGSGDKPLPAASVFAPGEITAPIDDGAAAFTPDGNTVVFMRGTDTFTLMESHREHGHWSKPQVAAFSGQWRDFDPAMAPDGSYLLFVSNRPTEPGGKPIDAVHNGTTRIGLGMAIWRVDHHGTGWGTPVRLSDAVNSCSMTFAPSVAADGTVYYMGCIGGGDFKPMRSTPKGGSFAPPKRSRLAMHRRSSATRRSRRISLSWSTASSTRPRSHIAWPCRGGPATAGPLLAIWATR